MNSKKFDLKLEKNDKSETPRDPVGKLTSKLREAKIGRKRDFKTHLKRFRDFEIRPKFFRDPRFSRYHCTITGALVDIGIETSISQ